MPGPRATEVVNPSCCLFLFPGPPLPSEAGTHGQKHKSGFKALDFECLTNEIGKSYLRDN